MAILGGLGAALAFASSTLCSSRSSRLIGAGSVLAWVALVGLAVTVPAAVFADQPELDAEAVALLGLAGVGNVLGLLLSYQALRTGMVGIVAPISPDGWPLIAARDCADHQRIGIAGSDAVPDQAARGGAPRGQSAR